MLHTVATETDDRSPDGLLAGYNSTLTDALDSAAETAVAESDVEQSTIDAVADGDVAALSLTEAAAIAALSDDAPDAEAIVLETRDHLLMGMTTAVLDVDAIAANIDVDLTGQEVQQAIEGRIEMSLAELAAIQSVIEQRLEA